MSNNEFFEITKEVTKEISKDVYEDIISLVAKPTGAVLGLIPRAIKAALSPLEKNGYFKRNITFPKYKGYLKKNSKMYHQNLSELPNLILQFQPFNT